MHLILSKQQNNDAMRIGLFVGSFDPFTIGHEAIVRRALPLFDKLIIGLGINTNKHYSQSCEERLQRIKKLYAEEANIEVKSYNGLTTDFAESQGANYLVKGVRSLKDFEYEREQAAINRKLSGIETILLFAEPELESVSSSVVRELERFGKDVHAFLPKGY